jgi:hypothetical protein
MSKKLHSIGNIVLLLVAASCASKPQLAVDEAWDVKADAERILKLSGPEIDWERRLEKKLSPSAVSDYKNQKLKGKDTPWDFVQDDPKLPRVLLVGDSHSINYTVKVRKKLKGIANVHRVLGDCGGSLSGVKNIGRWVNLEHWDLIHFNFGFADQDAIASGTMSLHKYAQNIREIVFYLKQTKAKLVWSSTYPTKPREVALEMNKAANKTMVANNIFINDIYAKALPYVNLDQKNNELSEDAFDDMGDSVANAIKSQLNFVN